MLYKSIFYSYFMSAILHHQRRIENLGSLFCHIVINDYICGV